MGRSAPTIIIRFARFWPSSSTVERSGTLAAGSTFQTDALPSGGDIRTWPRWFTVFVWFKGFPGVRWASPFLTGRPPGRASNERQFYLSPDDCRRSAQAGKRGIVIWIEQAIHLGAAGLESFGHLFSGDVSWRMASASRAAALLIAGGIVSSSLLCFLLMLRGSYGEKTAPGHHSGGPLPSQTSP